MIERNVATGAVPPGQALTRKFPVTGERGPSPEALDLEAWRLEVTGLVARPRELTHGEILALPQTDLVADIHCVTGWSHLGMRLTGVSLASVLEIARPTAGASFVRFVAYSPRAHDTSLPLDVAMRDTWLIHARDGAPLEPEHGWPLRAVTPSRYFYKSLKWVRRIELLADDRLGYWERESSYHNNGDPWTGNERFVTGSVDPAALARFRDSESFDRHRGARRFKIGLDLRGWVPRTRDLRELFLKRCDLRHADLAGADLRGANLSLSDLRGANLAGADATGADLEGANFAGADLTNADFTSAALSATKFFTRDADGTLHEARVDGLRWRGAHGLLEDHEAFLRERTEG